MTSCQKKIKVDYPSFNCIYCKQNKSNLNSLSQNFYLKFEINKISLLNDENININHKNIGKEIFENIKKENRIIWQVNLHIDSLIPMKIVDSVIKEFRRAGITKINYNLSDKDMLFKRYAEYSCTDKFKMPNEFQENLIDISFQEYQKTERNIDVFKPVPLFMYSVFGYENECSDIDVISCWSAPKRENVKIIYTDNNDNLFLNEQKIEKNKLLDSLDKFALYSDKLVIYEYTPNVLYKDYLEFNVRYTNKLQILRNSLSKTKYLKDYTTLTRDEKKYIKSVYPLQFYSYQSKEKYRDFFKPIAISDE